MSGAHVEGLASGRARSGPRETRDRSASLLGAGVLAVLLGIGPGAARVGFAQEELPLGPVRLDVTICVGSDQEGPVDPSCRSLRTRLLPMRFGSFALQREESFDISVRRPAAVALSTGNELEVRLVSIMGVQTEAKEIHMLVRLPDGGHTRVKVRNGRPFTIGGPRMSEGQMIIELRPSLRDGLPQYPNPGRVATTPGN